MKRDRLDELMAMWTRSIDRRPFLQVLAALVLALVAGHGTTPEQTGARKRQKNQKRQKRQKRRKPEGEVSSCRQRCHKKSGRARRRCRRRCQGDESVPPCDTDGDCAPCARCLPEGCVATCQTGEVCQNDRCTTPGPDICPPEGTEVVVTSYAEVADDYAQGSALALPIGPDAVANFVNERFTDLYDQFAPEVQDLISPELMADIFYILQNNRVHFEVPSEIGTFDGYFEGDTIQGYFTQIWTLNFWITATEPIPPGSDSPIEGRWEGQIFDPTGVIYASPFDIVVTFASVSGELTGTLDVAGVVANVPITNISVSESRPFSRGPFRDVRIFPEQTRTLFYALVGWGNADMLFKCLIDTQGQLIGIDIVPDWPVPPDPAAGLAVETAIRLPLDGVWWINSGGPRHYENHHVGDPTARHAYDLNLWNVSGVGAPNLEENADIWAWEQPVFAPAAGTVVEVVNDVPDNPLGIINATTTANLVALQTAPQEFLYLAYLRHGSVAVTVGEQVQEGQFLARVGNSGYSFGPHLHMQLQDRISLFDLDAVSLPFRFKDLLVNGQLEANPSPVMGDFVQHAGCPTPVPAAYAPQPERDRSSRAARGSKERPTMTQRSAKWLRSPAATPIDGPPSMPWGNR